MVLEKDRSGNSGLPEKMNVEKGYLFGRFGAIPVIPSFESLDWIRHEDTAATERGLPADET